MMSVFNKTNKQTLQLYNISDYTCLYNGAFFKQFLIKDASKVISCPGLPKGFRFDSNRQLHTTVYRFLEGFLYGFGIDAT